MASSEVHKQVMQTHFKAFRLQLEYLGRASASFEKQRGASPFATASLTHSHAPSPTPSLTHAPCPSEAEELLPVVDLDHFETALSSLVAPESGGLGTAKAGSAFAQLVAGRISRASECVSDDSTVTAQSHTRLHTHTHTVTSLHKALAITVLRRTSSVAAMTSFLREGGLKTVVKWLYISASSKDPPVSLSLLQHILEWLTHAHTHLPTACSVSSSPAPTSSRTPHSSTLLQTIHAAVEPPTATLLLDLSRRSEKLFSSIDKDTRFVCGFDHAALVPHCATRRKDRDRIAHQALKASIMLLYRQLFAQLGDKMPMQPLSAVAVQSKIVSSAVGLNKKRPLTGNSGSGNSGSNGIGSSGSSGDSPKSAKRGRVHVGDGSGNGSGGVSADKLSRFLDGKVGEKDSNAESSESQSGEEVKSPNRKVLHRSGRRRAPAEDLQVIVPFSTGDRNPGEACDMQADTAHNTARRKIKWGDEQADGVLLHTREFETLPPYEPTAEERRLEALRQGISEETLELGTGQGSRGTRKRGLRGGFGDLGASSSGNDRKKKAAERDPAAQRRETAARQQQQDRLDAAMAVVLPPGTRWVEPRLVSLSAEQQLLAGTIEVDSKEKKLQTQRIGTKLELSYFSQEDIPRDPEASARTIQHQQMHATPTVLTIPWQDLAMEMDMEAESDFSVQDETQDQAQQTGAFQTNRADDVTTSSGGDGSFYDSFERQLREPDVSHVSVTGADDLLSGLPDYVTMLDEQQLEILLEQLSEPENIHLLENSEHPGFLELVGRIAPNVKAAFLRKQQQELPSHAQQQRRHEAHQTHSTGVRDQYPSERRSRFSDPEGSPRVQSEVRDSGSPRSGRGDSHPVMSEHHTSPPRVEQNFPYHHHQFNQQPPPDAYHQHSHHPPQYQQHQQQNMNYQQHHQHHQNYNQHNQYPQQPSFPHDGQMHYQHSPHQHNMSNDSQYSDSQYSDSQYHQQHQQQQYGSFRGGGGKGGPHQY